MTKRPLEAERVQTARLELTVNQHSHSYFLLILPTEVLVGFFLFCFLFFQTPACHLISWLVFPLRFLQVTIDHYWMKYLFTQLRLVFTDILQEYTVQTYVTFHRTVMKWKAAVAAEHEIQNQGRILV